MVAASCEEQEGRRGDKGREPLASRSVFGRNELPFGNTREQRTHWCGPLKRTSSGLNESVKAHLQTLQAQQGVPGHDRPGVGWRQCVYACTRA